MRRLPICALAALALIPAAPAAAARPTLIAAPGRVTVTYDESRRMMLERFEGAAVAPDGTIYAAGATGRGQRLTLTAFRPDGSIDRSFGDRGGVIAPRDVRAGTAVMRGGDGRLVALGNVETDLGASYGPPVLMRFGPDGRFDAGYGGDGVAEVPGLEQAGCLGCGAAAQFADGSVAVAGYSGRAPERSRFAVGRVRPDGSADPAFGGDGLATPLPGPGTASQLVVQPGGQRIVVFGSRGNAADPAAELAFVLVGLRADGSLDPAFGQGGTVVLPEDGAALAQDAAGRLLVLTYPERGRGESAVLRYTPTGVLDPTWGDGGRVSLGDAVIGRLFPTATGVTVAAGEAKRLHQFHLDPAGRITGRETTRLRLGGGSYPRGGLAPLGRQSFFGSALTMRDDGSLIVGSGAEITRGDDGDTDSRSEAALAFVGADGSLAPTVEGRRPRLRGRLRRDRLGRVQRTDRLRLVLRAGQRGLARVRVRARGRTVARRMVPLWRSGRRVAAIRLNKAGRRIVARTGGRVRFRVRVRANDMAGNRIEIAAGATLRR